MNATIAFLVVIVIIGIGLITIRSFVNNKTRDKKPTYMWRQQPDPTKNKYTYTTLDSQDDLYCGYFGKKSVTPSSEHPKSTIYTCGCEQPTGLENGTFDKKTCDYTCSPGYEKWFTANGQQYTTKQGLKNTIDAKELNAMKPDDKSYCIPLTGSLKACQTGFDRNAYKNAYHMYSNENWSDECYASTKDDCQEGYNFQRLRGKFGTCNKHSSLCDELSYYEIDDPCFPKTCKKQKGCKTRQHGCQNRCGVDDDPLPG